ncbi:SMI1/KNR4 family protein [Streptodolium elevatio]|uniref:SMI1/KNR4 family protein n=1 Tax=Streptodolium elevatio TaxID=3157996 RepID=A0ABV3DKR6_9ACTN
MAWVELESALGTRLPSDYKEILETYPRLVVDDFIRLLDPDSKSWSLRPVEANQSNSAWLADMRSDEDFADEFPYPAFPDRNGVLLWGNTTNGDYCYWLAVGDPESWTVVVSRHKGSTWTRHPCGVAEFLSTLGDSSPWPDWPEGPVSASYGRVQ